MVCETTQLDTWIYLFRFVEREINQGILRKSQAKNCNIFYQAHIISFLFHSFINLKLINVIFCFMGSVSENKSMYG